MPVSERRCEVSGSTLGEGVLFCTSEYPLWFWLKF